MPTAEAFWDARAEKYAKSPVKNETAYQETMARTRAYLSPNDHILEIGCGTGSTALLLAPHVSHITAGDISGNMIEIAWDKADRQGVENVTFRQGTMLAGESGTIPYDAVLAFNLLHLVETAPATVRAAHAALKPGGLFISKTVCLGEKRSLWRPILFVMRALGLAPFVKLYRVAELEAMIESAGFEIIETGTYPASPPSRFIVARKK